MMRYLAFFLRSASGARCLRCASDDRLVELPTTDEEDEVGTDAEPSKRECRGELSDDRPEAGPGGGWAMREVMRSLRNLLEASVANADGETVSANERFLLPLPIDRQHGSHKKPQPFNAADPWLQ
jgi:hypothetical protein